MYERKPTRAKSDVMKRLMRGVSEAALSFGKRIIPRLLAMVSRDVEARPSDAVLHDETLPSEPTPMQIIMDRRVRLEAQIEAAADCGYVRDSLATSLLANHEDELAERRRLLTDLEHQLQASLRRLNALCPAPPEPEPAPLPAPRPRQFTAVKDWFGSGSAGRVD